MAKKTVNVFIGAKNKMAAGLRSSLKSFKKFNRKMKAGLRSLGQTFKRVGLIAGTAFVGLVKFGNQFRTQMAQVNTMLGDSSTAIPRLTKQVRDLSAEFGVAKKTLTEGLYQALSAGIPEGNAIEFLRVATEAAVGGVTDVKTSVDGLTTVMNSYGIAADKARDVSDILFTVVKDGKINYEELSENIGKIAPTAKIAGVGLRELSAMIATLVKVEKPERAMTALRQSMIFAAKNGKTLLQVLNEFEGASLEDLLKAGVNTKSAAGIALMASNMSVLRKEMVIFKDTAGKADAAFQKVSAMRHWQKIWQSILSVTSRVGEMIDKTVGPAISRAAEKIRNFGKSEQFDKFIAKVKESTEDVVNLISVLASGGTRRTAAIKGMGEIIKLSFISGAQSAVNIIAKGVAAAWDKAGKSALKSASKRAAMMTVDPLSLIPLGKRLGVIKSKKTDATDFLDTKKTDLELAKAFANLGKVIAPRATDNMPTDIFRPTVRRTTGNLTGVTGGVAGAGGGIGDSTSMLGIGELFTMMQTGQARASELGELQKQNATLDKILVAVEDGGVE